MQLLLLRRVTMSMRPMASDGNLRVFWGGDLEKVGLLIDGRQGFAERVIGP